MSWLSGERSAPVAARGKPSDGIVLPRLLRRPARLLGRLAAGEFEAPRYSASILTAGFLGIFSLYGAYLGGYVPTIAQAVTSRLGFAIDAVKVSGHRETSLGRNRCRPQGLSRYAGSPDRGAQALCDLAARQ
jgi:cell division protein FtsQ